MGGQDLAGHCKDTVNVRLPSEAFATNMRVVGIVLIGLLEHAESCSSRAEDAHVTVATNLAFSFFAFYFRLSSGWKMLLFSRAATNPKGVGLEKNISNGHSSGLNRVVTGRYSSCNCSGTA